MRRGLAFAAILLLSLGPSFMARAAGLLEKNFWLSGPRYDAVLPPCDHPGALDRIARQFGEKEFRYWNSDLRIAEFLQVRQLSFRPWAVDTMPRRFCSGTVVTTDGRRRRVDYSIIEDGGAIGLSWGIEWCVAGTDRHWAYNPACRMARP